MTIFNLFVRWQIFSFPVYLWAILPDKVICVVARDPKPSVWIAMYIRSSPQNSGWLWLTNLIACIYLNCCTNTFTWIFTNPFKIINISLLIFCNHNILDYRLVVHMTAIITPTHYLSTKLFVSVSLWSKWRNAKAHFSGK